jgi:HEAT repeat protein
MATGRTPTAAAQKVYNQGSADMRREGINELSDRNFGRKAPYTEQYQIMAQTDRDWLVRAAAIRALNRSRDSSATGIYVKALADENDIVRVEACKALVHMPDPAAPAALVKLLGDASQPRDVRIWAAEALQHYRTLDVARTLASQLQGREFGVAWQSRKSLVTITGQDLGYDEPAWLKYLADRPFG